MAQVKAELAALLADVVVDRLHRFALGRALPASQLQEKDRDALRGPEQQDSVHLRQVPAFVEKVYGEDDIDLPLP